MNNKNIFKIFCVFTSFCSASYDPLFDSAFLRNYDQVTTYLMEQEGFTRVNFLSTDGLVLDGLCLIRPDATFNMVFCSGFLPGRKEGLATFLRLVPTDCNLLFFDARGHGVSDGKFLSRIHQYGAHEYRDVIGALEFMHEQAPLPIVLYGTCAGAFHSARTLIKLGDQIESLQIKGLIFDSGWASFSTVARTGMVGEANQQVAELCTLLYKLPKKQVKDTYLYRALSTISTGIMKGLHFFIAKPILYANDRKINLIDKIHTLKIPILYVHDMHDDYAEFAPVNELINNSNDATVWCPEQSKHACHQLKHGPAYKQQLDQFLKRLL